MSLILFTYFIASGYKLCSFYFLCLENGMNVFCIYAGHVTTSALHPAPQLPPLSSLSKESIKSSSLATATLGSSLYCSYTSVVSFVVNSTPGLVTRPVFSSAQVIPFPTKPVLQAQ